MAEIDPSRRAVVTGLGAVMPIGNDFETYWRNLRAGVTGTRTIQGFDATNYEVRIAAEVLDFDPASAMDPKMARRMSRFVAFSMAAGKEAVRSSGIDFAAMSEEQRDRVGVVVNTGGGGIEEIIDGTHVNDQKGPRFVSAFAVPALSGSMGACMLSMEYGLTGPVMTQVAACASSVIAFHDALRLIRSGECDVVLAGGAEAPVLPMAVAALGNMGALSKRNDDPATASRPFDRTRDGFVLGEGAGVVVVESLEHARKRGATVYAEVIGGEHDVALAREIFRAAISLAPRHFEMEVALVVAAAREQYHADRPGAEQREVVRQEQPGGVEQHRAEHDPANRPEPVGHAVRECGNGEGERHAPDQPRQDKRAQGADHRGLPRCESPDSQHQRQQDGRNGSDYG